MTTPARRIVTLIPSATEIVDLLGLTDQVVGRSHECDHPIEIESRPVLTRPRLDPQASGGDIHRSVEELLRDSLAIYDLDTTHLAELEPTHIVTQTQCDVCAVALRDVEAAAAACLRYPAEIVALAPMQLGDVINDVREEKPLSERAQPSAARTTLQAALDDYPMKGAMIDYERVTGVRKVPGTKKKKPKRK